MLRISERGVYRLMSRGEITSVKVGGRTLLEPGEVRRFIASQRATPNPRRHPSEQPASSRPPQRRTRLDHRPRDRQDEGFDAHALSFRYGQRHRSSSRRAARSPTQAGVAEHVEAEIDLRMFGGSALTDDIDVPKGRAADEMGEGIPVTYVPARNTVFLSFALAWAEVLGADDIFIGVNALDYCGYPDCRPEYIEAFEQMANLATKRGVEGPPAADPHAADRR